MVFYSPRIITWKQPDWQILSLASRVPQALVNLTPTGVYFGRSHEVLNKRAEIKKRTMQHRYLQNMQTTTV